jgi:hypothetical protein
MHGIDHPLYSTEDHVGAASSGTQAADLLTIFDDEALPTLQTQQADSETL